MRLKIELNMDNEAFGETVDERGAEVARILDDAARYVAEVGLGVGSGRWLKDLNGNIVGKLTVD